MSQTRGFYSPKRPLRYSRLHAEYLTQLSGSPGCVCALAVTGTGGPALIVGVVCTLAVTGTRGP
eukprot:1195480-Prorocentrum_minimum.AAC.5